jgi:hypothetical protein
MAKHTLPDDPLDFIQRCVREKRIAWTYHITMRLKGRFIARQEILDSVADYEMIEEYPKNKYYRVTWSFLSIKAACSMCCLPSMWTVTMSGLLQRILRVSTNGRAI